MSSDQQTKIDVRVRTRSDSTVEAAPPTQSVDASAQRHARHELRSPLNQIIGYAELLQEDARDQGQQQLEEDLAKIEAAGRRMLTLIDRYFASPSVEMRVSRRPLGSVEQTTQQMEPAAGESAQREIRVTTAVTPATNGRLLVVDDDASNRDLLSRRLKASGYAVSGAASGVQALERLESERFELVLLDVVMPDLSGLEVLSKIRSHYDAGDLPVIMATALDSSGDVVEALRLGANDYVTKPLDVEVVLARVATQLGLKQARDKVRELNDRLDSAQQRIAALADAAPQTPEDAATWARSLAREVENALEGCEVSVWLFDGPDLLNLSATSAIDPTATELAELRRKGVVYRQAEVLIAVGSNSGALYGTMLVQTGNGRFGEAEEHLVTKFARHLGGTLELGEMRRELARTAAQRRATEQDLIQAGIELLHMCPECNRCYSQFETHCQEHPVGVSIHPPPRPLPMVVAERYRLLQMVGEGGMGSVFRAQDQRLERVVALKLIKPEHSHNDSVRIRFQNEARMVARLDHPGVTAVFDSGEADEGSLYMVMEWLPGTDLGKLLKEQGPGSPRQVAALLRQTAAALTAAHEAQLVHRDIKPENIFVHPSADGITAKVLDFGVAKEMTRDTSLTKTGNLVGTPLYMSPEQVMNRPVDARSDTYSLATVAYEALTGRRTITSDVFVDVVLAVAADEAPKLSDSIEGVPEALDSAFARGLAKDPDQRPATTQQWVDSFADMLETLETEHHWDL